MLISILTVLSILTVVSSMTVVYPKVVLTVVFIPTVAYILSGLHPHSCLYILTVASSLSDYSPTTQSTLLFHVIFISAYPAVRVKLYAYDLITTICWKGKQSASLQPYAKGRNQRRNNAIDSFGKGFHMLKDHVQTV